MLRLLPGIAWQDPLVARRLAGMLIIGLVVTCAILAPALTWHDPISSGIEILEQSHPAAPTVRVRRHLDYVDRVEDLHRAGEIG